MCKFCDESEESPRCVDCGMLVCGDVQRADDVLSPLYVSESGNGPLCHKCIGKHEQDDDDFDPYGYINEFGEWASHGQES